MNQIKLLFIIGLLAFAFDIGAQEASKDVSVSGFTASCRSVSSEELAFNEIIPGIYYAHDSIGFDSDCVLTCNTAAEGASVEQIKGAYPMPGACDTAVFIVRSQDLSASATYKVVIARSLFQSKFGFLDEIDNKVSSFDGWSFSGKRYPSASRGTGGAYPGENAMRIYKSSGAVTTPKFSSVSTLSFVGKFSYTDDETLIIQKSTDGITFTDIKTYVPGDEMPAYTGESPSDPLSSPQILTINDEDVYLRFIHNGDASEPRILFDDIGIRAKYDYTPVYSIEFRVFDFDRNPLSGAEITIDDQTYITDVNGRLFLSDLTPGEINYSVSYDSYLSQNNRVIVNGSVLQNVIMLDDELEVFLASGQSNMAGRADIEDNIEPIEGAYLMNDKDEWIPAVNPMNLYSNIRKSADLQKLGPSYTFIQTMAKYLDKRVCIIVNAKGGTHIREFIEGGDYHEALMERLTKAKDYGQVKAMIWHQGESGNSSYSAYLSNLNGLVSKIRTSVGSDFYFVAGQLGPWYDKYKGFNDNLLNISSEIENASYVTNTSLWHLGDSTHFNTASQLLYGRRYAKSVLAAVYDIHVAVFKVDIEGDVFIKVGEDTLNASGSFTSLWNDQSKFEIHAPKGKVFSALEIDGVKKPDATGLSEYIIVPGSTDAYIQVKAATIDSGLSALSHTLGDELVIYPNPATDIVMFSGRKDEYSAALYDLSGHQVLSAERTASLDVSTLDVGCYMIKLMSGEETVFKKIIIN